MKRVLFLCVITMLFFSCTTFSHPTKNAKDFDQDRRECEQYAAANPSSGTCKKDSFFGCATCDDVKRCLEEQKDWKRVR